jgi:hypothetical protein
MPVHMSKLSMFAVGVVMAFGCGSKDPLDKAISGLEDWKGKMCACKDKACADKVHEDYKKWENDVMEPMFKDKKESDMPKDKMEKAEKLDGVAVCWTWYLPLSFALVSTAPSGVS